jgi:hypothetical protein
MVGRGVGVATELGRESLTALACFGLLLDTREMVKTSEVAMVRHRWLRIAATVQVKVGKGIVDTRHDNAVDNGGASAAV